MVLDERLGELRDAINTQTRVLAERMGTEHVRTLP